MASFDSQNGPTVASKAMSTADSTASTISLGMRIRKRGVGRTKIGWIMEIGHALSRRQDWPQNEKEGGRKWWKETKRRRLRRRGKREWGRMGEKGVKRGRKEEEKEKQMRISWVKVCQFGSFWLILSHRVSFCWDPIPWSITEYHSELFGSSQIVRAE